MKLFAQTLSSPLIEKLIIMPVFSAYETEEPAIFEKFKELLNALDKSYTCIRRPEDIVQQIISRETADTVLLMIGAGKSSEFSKKVSAICTQKELFFT